MPFLVKLCLGVLALYLAAVALLFAVQRRLIYAPSAAAPPPAVLAARGLEPWGAHAARPARPQRGVAVVFHGNAGAAADRAYFADALAARGLTTVLVEYPGYGGRAGAPSEAALVADGLAAVEQAHAAFGAPVTVWGESLGAGVAAAVLARTRVPVRGAVLVTPWATLPDLSAERYPWVPVRALLRDRYDSVANLRAWGGPVGVALAERDAVIPPHHAERLATAVGAARVWRFPQAGHNTWPADAGAPWWDEAVALALGDAALGDVARTAPVGAGVRP